jgi:hypothetical protein
LCVPMRRANSRDNANCDHRAERRPINRGTLRQTAKAPHYLWLLLDIGCF